MQQNIEPKNVLTPKEKRIFKELSKVTIQTGNFNGFFMPSRKLKARFLNLKHLEENRLIEINRYNNIRLSSVGLNLCGYVPSMVRSN